VKLIYKQRHRERRRHRPRAVLTGDIASPGVPPNQKINLISQVIFAFGVKEILMKPNKTITIMADFGLGPYAWLKDASDESDYVGVNIANSRTRMDEFDISDRLQK
jgi:hypothetical protein